MSLEKKGEKEARECGLKEILEMKNEEFEQFTLEGLRTLRMQLSNKIASIERLSGRDGYSEEDDALSSACEKTIEKIDKIMDKLFKSKRR